MAPLTWSISSAGRNTASAEPSIANFSMIIHAAALDGDLDAGLRLEGLGDDVQAANVGEARGAHDDLAGLGAGWGGEGQSGGKTGRGAEFGVQNSHSFP